MKRDTLDELQTLRDFGSMAAAVFRKSSIRRS
jgi:hypothetical protein